MNPARFEEKEFFLREAEPITLRVRTCGKDGSDLSKKEVPFELMQKLVGGPTLEIGGLAGFEYYLRGVERKNVYIGVYLRTAETGWKLEKPICLTPEHPSEKFVGKDGTYTVFTVAQWSALKPGLRTTTYTK